jgi:hypothetical protein
LKRRTIEEGKNTRNAHIPLSLSLSNLTQRNKLKLGRGAREEEQLMRSTNDSNSLNFNLPFKYRETRKVQM